MDNLDETLTPQNIVYNTLFGEAVTQIFTSANKLCQGVEYLRRLHECSEITPNNMNRLSLAIPTIQGEIDKLRKFMSFVENNRNEDLFNESGIS